MNRLVLLRHGRTEGTERHLYYGATDLPLLEDGVQDLQLAAARGVYPSPDGFTFVTSGMLRAKLAAVVCTGLHHGKIHSCLYIKN